MDSIAAKRGSSLDITSYKGPRKDLVRKMYDELLSEQASLLDKVFISGYTLRELDPNLVVLEDGTEHPRVSS